ncbi:hypothetical protein [Leifsonia sp. 22587]|uniref:hypothetical protein n=1 Tax=Leifsonia sp. 22587 TaxID=3453946 RepID=UPI003F877534
MTDPKTPRPEFWRNLAWGFAGVAALNLVGGIVLVVFGRANGWINVVLGLICVHQTMIYFRLWKKAGREEGRTE